MQTADKTSIAISVDRLCKTYPVPFLPLKKLLRKRYQPPVEALREISFTVADGEIFGLIGPNGAGKTTLTKIIATLVRPTAGTVSVKGYDTVKNDETVRRQLGLSGAEERSFYWRLTAEHNLLFFARLYGLSGHAAKKRISTLLELLELQEFARRRFAELSTGNKQRLAVARAMLANPPVLLLDEPTRSLDPLAASRTRALIKSLARTKGITIFLTSHNLAEVEELCDRVAIISQGRIRAMDAPENLRAAHTEEERVTIRLSGLSAGAAEQVLAGSYPCEFLVAQNSPPGESLVRFMRTVNDNLLDNVLRILQQSGGVIRSVESEKPTLLDVLESYEKHNPLSS